MEVFQKVAREISTHLHMVFFEVPNVETRDIHTCILHLSKVGTMRIRYSCLELLFGFSDGYTVQRHFTKYVLTHP
jgi:hypothetical protein